ncbi:MAG: hypothetical protein QM793_01370 [Muricomes sp.]
MKAGEWIFPKKLVHSKHFEVVYNAVDRGLFQYDPAVRRTVRQELKIEDETYL